MSADLYLYAVPNDDTWRKTYAFLTSADFTTATDEGFSRDSDGYLIEDGLTASDGEPLRGLTFDDLSDLETQLGLRRADRCHIGQYSWMTDPDEGVPAAVGRVFDLIGTGRLLTPGMAGELGVAMNLPNRSRYGRRRIEYIPPEQYSADVERWKRATGRERQRMATPIAPGQVLITKPRSDSSSGLVRRQKLKKWLHEHVGEYLIARGE